MDHAVVPQLRPTWLLADTIIGVAKQGANVRTG